MPNDFSHRRPFSPRRLFLIGIHAAVIVGAIVAASMHQPGSGMMYFQCSSLDIYRDENGRLLVSGEQRRLKSAGSLFYSARVENNHQISRRHSAPGRVFRRHFVPMRTVFQGELKVFPDGNAFSSAEMAALRLLAADAYEQNAYSWGDDMVLHRFPEIDYDLPQLLRSGKDRITAVFWPGVIYNAGKLLSLTAAAYCLVAFGVLVRREMRDRRRSPGACTQCGYELGGPFTRCPECGFELAEPEAAQHTSE